MSARFKIGFAILIITGNWLASSVRAQTPPATPAESLSAPSVAIMKSPVELFRKLLAMTPADREKFLADRTPEKREGLLAKIREYEAMKPADRQLSLCATELQSYLEQLVKTTPTNRATQLASIPEPYRKIIADRLSLWDVLPPDLQKDVLAHEATKRYFVGPANEGISNEAWRILPSPLQDEVIQLSKISPEERQQSFELTRQFFDLTDEDKQKVLGTLSNTERRQLDETLQTLQRLPKEQLDQCFKTVRRMANLTETERHEFWKDANRWNKMSADERAIWQNMVNRLPPLPPEGIPMADDLSKIMPPGMNTNDAKAEK